MAIRITGMNSGLDTDAMVTELVHAYEKQGEKYTKAKTKTEWKQEAWKSLNTKVKSFFTKYADTMRFSEGYTKKSTTSSDSSVASVVSSDNAVIGTQTLSVSKLAKAGYLTGAEIGKGMEGSTKLSDLGFTGSTTVTIGIGKQDPVTGEYADTKSFDVTEDMTLDEFAKCLSTVGNANWDKATGRFFLSSKESGADNNFTIIGGEEGSALNDLLSKTGLVGEGSSKIEGDDAEITLNGAKFTSSSNTFSINGLTVTAKKVTGEGEEVTLSTDTDYDAVYDKIKNFISEYSKLMNEFDKLYNADSAKDYEPLSDDEKEAMSDDEIEKWETKIKDSLLRRDADLDTISSTMRNVMLQGIEIDGKQYSLSSFGISTLGYFEAADNEKNALHIDGNPDDEFTSANTDKLKAAIAADPSTVTEFFTKLSNNLYTAMNKISSNSNNYTSYGSFYSDKKIQSEITEQGKQVSKWEKYVADMEEKYYKQFTAMESAISKLNDQQSYLSQLFA